MTKPKTHIVTFADLTLETRTDGKPVYRWWGTDGDDLIIFNVPAEQTRGIPIAAFGGPGRDSMTKTPGTGPMKFYGDEPRGKQGAPLVGDDPDVFDFNRIDLGAGDRGVGGGPTDYILHKSDYGRFGAAEMRAFRPDEDRLIANGEAGFRVTDVDFRFIDRTHATEREGLIRSITIEFESSNPLAGKSTAEVWFNAGREPEPEEYWLDWLGGTGAAGRKIEAAQAFVEAGVDDGWLVIA